MTALPLLPDVEVLVGDYLRTHPDVEALDARVAGTTPANHSKPWVRLTQLDAPKEGASRVEHLIMPMLQLDCYAGSTAMSEHSGQAEASLLARTVRAVLVDMPAHSFSGVVVSSAVILSMPRIPDTDFEPARERFVLTVQLHLHAA